MSEKTYRDAIREALREEMLRDELVLIMGEEVGVWGGTYAVTRGFYDEFGERRILDTPIAEDAIVGAAVGAAMGGLRPVAELMTINFSLVAMDQIVNNAAKIHFMFGGQARVPLVIRAPTGWGQLAATHSQSLEAWFAHLPGLLVVMPATPYDAKGLLKTAIRSDNPVMFIEHARLYGVKGEVPDGEFTLPIGVSDVKRPGRDITIVSYSRMLHVALGAASVLAKDGIECEVIDLRTLRPLDMAPVYDSVQKTHRALIVEEDWTTCGMGAEIAARIGLDRFDALDVPVQRMGQVEVPVPYARNLEALMFPDETSVARKVMEMVA
ncbi:MAG TPA: alpha-ketoacid dehydrogenase subunit beta [Deltaproteobacteria bacterium]|nr:MAG: pyruvate dehydrogenase [Deltaproteobacteria bacterium GWA2_65_63]OGP28346.1 MAG: pyruvate dehydrogenase [Deltaproteobacteria bacterium GWB2_65_81]OGP38959.1 MAG: pyruvate dehydrogenase [Deltaproteobacteria bacterium GWC2_66_88]OGP78151.1 MAG: pyruvate dehydrogenase [Deltaproteobacteria bacterium RBG_16_66_15]HAM32216.1 alpha-ketoacid dehydrogenase subunit beta [Deltaproteobacteria bacterium]